MSFWVDRSAKVLVLIARLKVRICYINHLSPWKFLFKKDRRTDQSYAAHRARRYRLKIENQFPFPIFCRTKPLFCGLCKDPAWTGIHLCGSWICEPFGIFSLCFRRKWPVSTPTEPEIRLVVSTWRRYEVRYWIKGGLDRLFQQHIKQSITYL